MTDASHPAALQHEVVRLRGEIARGADALARSTTVVRAQAATIDRLRRQMAEVLRRLYGRTSEKLDPAQLELSFDELADGVLAAEDLNATLEPQTTAPDDEESLLAPKARRKSRRGVRAIGPHIERERREVLPPEEERCCPECGDAKSPIGDEVSEEIEYVPARIRVIEHARVKLACRRCEAHVSVAPAPLRPIPRSKAGPGLLAHVVVSKYADHLPLYRQEKMLRRSGIELSRQVLCDWVAGVATLLEPLVSSMRERLLESGYVRADETTVRMQKGAKKGRTEQCYFWAYLGGGVVVMDFRRSRARDGPNAFLTDFAGDLQCDGYGGYNDLGAKPEIRRLGCWAHVRRRFYEAYQADPAGGALVLGLIQKLYVIEAGARDLDDEARRSLREKCSRPLVERIEGLLPILRERALPRSALGEAVAYAAGQWSTLTVFLEDGRLGIDNNPVENAVRGIAVGRKNWLFAGSPEGGRRAAVIYSVIESAKLAGVEPMAYLTDVIARLPATPVSRVRELVPAAWAAEQSSPASR